MSRADGRTGFDSPRDAKEETKMNDNKAKWTLMLQVLKANSGGLRFEQWTEGNVWNAELSFWFLRANVAVDKAG